MLRAALDCVTKRAADITRSTGRGTATPCGKRASRGYKIQFPPRETVSWPVESDGLARRWSALETLAASGYDYFRMTDRQRNTLPIGPEMAAIEVELDALWEKRKRGLTAITKLDPRNVHEVASLLVIAARMDLHDPGPTAPLVNKAIMFLASAKCPGCGEPYVPPSLPTA